MRKLILTTIFFLTVITLQTETITEKSDNLTLFNASDCYKFFYRIIEKEHTTANTQNEECGLSKKILLEALENQLAMTQKIIDALKTDKKNAQKKLQLTHYSERKVLENEIIKRLNQLDKEILTENDIQWLCEINASEDMNFIDLIVKYLPYRYSP